MLRWGLLGTSFISETMAAAIASSHGSVITAVSGRAPDRLADFAARHGIAKAYGDQDALLADPQVDVVYVGLPNSLHHDAVIRAAARGKAVVSEKSLTTTMAEAAALADAVRAGNVFFMEGLMYLNHPLIAELGATLRSGRLGRLRAVNGFYAADIWKLVNPQGGGTLFNLGCYPASLLHYVVQTACGPQAFRERTSSGFGNVSPHDGNLCDAVLSVRFANGVLATLQSTDSYGMSHGFTVYGERGQLRFVTNPWLPTPQENVIEILEYGHAPEEIRVSSGYDAFQHQVFVVERCLREGRVEAPRPSPQLADSLEIMELLTEWQAHCLAGAGIAAAG
ncbi:Gfo/Idh/MocA family oxidoreductase [Rhizobium sp. CG5]|uniref:Gfo/Idh/MocA family protein n=1 Tax=Rhizobium sp. CG5 TaxID=2726076 RepID=UPI0020348AB4|nr:Gfo/Idh/MocA family oxidoreductase [Rhizobium sp. CG5]MCM2474161.1 Gfo/Idh/MocA family oxidoreductase [Rhizobium sp. CG5]